VAKANSGVTTNRSRAQDSIVGTKMREASPFSIEWPPTPEVERPWTYFSDLMSWEMRERIETVMPYLVKYVRVALIRAALGIGYDETEPSSGVSDEEIMQAIRQEIPPPCPLDDILDKVGRNLGLPESDILVVMLRAVERGELVLGDDMRVTVPELRPSYTRRDGLGVVLP